MRISRTSLILLKGLDQIEIILPWLGILLVLSVSWWLRVHYLWVQPLDYDEGHWLMFGVLVNAGYPAYSVTFVGIPPLALWLIQLGAFLFNTTLAVRYPMMLFSLLGVGAFFWSFQPWKNHLNLLIGLLAATFLSFNAAYFHNSASIMAEAPSVAMSLLSLALAQHYYFERKLFWLALSGITFALSLALKIFLVFLPLLIGVLILLAALDRQANCRDIDASKAWQKIFSRHYLQSKTIASIMRQLVIAGGIWLGGFLLPLFIFVILYDPQAMYHQVMTFRLELRQVWEQQITFLDNIITVGQMWLKLAPLGIGALLGIVMSWRRRWLNVSLWSGWLVMATALLIWHIPLRERYMVMLVPPLAALSGIGVAEGVRWLSHRLKHYGFRLSEAVAILPVVVIVGWTLATPVKSAMLPPSPDIFPDLNLNAVQYIWKNSLPDDCIITDDQRFAFAVDRLAPAALSETSWARIATNWVTVEDIADQVTRHDCPMVVYADWRFDHHLPDLRARLRELYFLEITFDERLVVYTGNKQITKSPALPLEAQFGQIIRLQGIDFSPPMPWRPGQEVRAATYWTVLKPPQRAYKIFLQLRNDQDETITSFDHFPFPAPGGNYRLTPNIDNYQNYSPEEIAIYPAKGMWPTYAWPMGQMIRAVTPLTLPSDLPAGEYTFYIGMYDPDTQTRLSIPGKTGERDALLLTSIKISN